MEFIDYYALLGIDVTASQEEIRCAYKEMVRFWHPDRNKNPNAKEVFHKIHKANEVLSDENAKKAYDALINAKILKLKKDNAKDTNNKRMKEELFRREATHAKKQKPSPCSIDEEQARAKRESWRRFREEMAASIRSNYSSDNDPAEEDPGATIKVMWDELKSSYTEFQLRSLFSKYGVIDYIIVKHKRAYIAFKLSYSAYMALEKEAGEVENPLKINWSRKNKLTPEASKKPSSINSPQGISNAYIVPQASQHESLESMVFANLRRAAGAQQLKEMNS